MKTGDIRTSWASGTTLIVEYQDTYSESANNSDCVITVMLYSPNALNISARSGNTLVVDGTTYEFESPAVNTGGGTTHTLYQTTISDIPHNADGTKSISISCRFRFNATLSGTYYGAQTVNGTVELETPIKAATITSASDFTDEQNPTINYSNPSGTRVSSLQACISFDGTAADIAYRTISRAKTSYTFTLTEAERNTLRNATRTSKTKKVYFIVKSVINGATTLSKLQKTLTIVNAAPMLETLINNATSSTVALTGSNQKFIRYFSTAEVFVNANPLKGATINSHITTCGSQYFTTPTGTFENIESNEISISTTDSRGYTTVETFYLQMVDYIRLTCNLSNNKPDTDGRMIVECAGNYWNGNFGAVQNTLQVQYRWKPQNGIFTEWANMNVSQSGTTYTATAPAITGLDYRATYVFECRAIDKLLTISTGENPLKSLPVFHWSENDVIFEVPVIFNAGTTGGTAAAATGVEDDFTITGDLRLKNSGNYGNTIYFGDGFYCYISEPSDDKLLLKASTIDFTGKLNHHGQPMEGSWTPTLNGSAISSYSTRQGWYSRIGDTVSIGWFVKANCNSGYNSTSISISGLPFVPVYSAAGGGMCAGAYVSGGFNFQCWAANTDGTITARVQSCNNTAATNISTSASGCFYRSGGGEITLSGSITYITNG